MRPHTGETPTGGLGYYCRHVRAVDDPMLKGKWLKVRKELTEEMGLVRSLEGEKRALVGAPAVPSLRSSRGAHDDDDGAASSNDAAREAGGPPLLLPTHHVSYSRREAAHLQRAYGGGRDDPPAAVDPGGTDDDPAVWRPPSRGPLPPPSRPRPSPSSGRQRDDAAAAATPAWARRRSLGDTSDSPSTTAPSRVAALAARGGRGAAALPRSTTGAAAAAGRTSPNNGRTSPTVSRTNSRRVAPDVKEVRSPPRALAKFRPSRIPPPAPAPPTTSEPAHMGGCTAQAHTQPQVSDSGRDAWHAVVRCAGEGGPRAFAVGGAGPGPLRAAGERRTGQQPRREVRHAIARRSQSLWGLRSSVADDGKSFAPPGRRVTLFTPSQSFPSIL